MGTGYQFVHAADMMHCAENHVKSECTWVGRSSSTGWGGGGLLVWAHLWGPSWLHSSGAALAMSVPSLLGGLSQVSPLLGDTCLGSWQRDSTSHGIMCWMRPALLPP